MQPVFEEDDDYVQYLEWIKDYMLSFSIMRRFNKPVVFWARVVDGAEFLVVVCQTVVRKAVICMDKEITNGLGKKIEFKVI